MSWNRFLFQRQRESSGFVLNYPFLIGVSEHQSLQMPDLRVLLF